jgi:hypothetical protein
LLESFQENSGQKNAPSLAVGGKSTFSEGGGDKRWVQKSTLVRNCTRIVLRCSKKADLNSEKRQYQFICQIDGVVGRARHGCMHGLLSHHGLGLTKSLTSFS